MATVADLERIQELIGEAVAELRPLRGGGLWFWREARYEPFEPELRRALADDRSHVVVGTIDGYPVGYAVAHLEDLRDGSVLARLDDLFVESGARRVGVGEAMMDAVLDWCRDQGCRGIDALALPGNRDTKNFFEGFGLTARAIVVHRDLRDDEAPD
ncbi:MAG: GNAT family N-acetyltransferase [Acidimicrobiia bacterium]|nr:GNAT family N-acetyltransferase [Acidimicrobiia bacterium]